jgi:hypothetical protein
VNLTRPLRMIEFLIVLAVLALVAACTTFGVPSSQKTAGTAGLIAYAIPGHVVSRYIGMHYCTTPITEFPCKQAAVEAKLKAADNIAYTTAIAFDDAAQSGAADVAQKQKDAADALKKLKDEQAKPEVADQIKMADAKEKTQP